MGEEREAQTETEREREREREGERERGAERERERERPLCKYSLWVYSTGNCSGISPCGGRFPSEGAVVKTRKTAEGCPRMQIGMSDGLWTSLKTAHFLVERKDNGPTVPR